MAVYSVRFLSAPNINSAAVALAHRYTVPANRVAVVRSVDLFVHVVGTVIFGRLSGQWHHIASSKGVGQWQLEHWSGRQVVNAGEVIGVEWIDGGVGIQCSGYLLHAQ